MCVQEGRVWRVECRGKAATMDRSRYISGTKGACILYQGQWITPTKVEELAGGGRDDNNHDL